MIVERFIFIVNIVTRMIENRYSIIDIMGELILSLISSFSIKLRSFLFIAQDAEVLLFYKRIDLLRMPAISLHALIQTYRKNENSPRDSKQESATRGCRHVNH